MKNKHLILIAVCSILSHHLSASQVLTINYQHGQDQLAEDYKSYLQYQLKSYQNNPLSLDSLIQMSTTITGSCHKSYIRDIYDDERNTFLHVAVTKQDLPFIKDMFNYFSTMHDNKEFKSPLDLAIEQLHPCSHNLKTPDKIAILETIAHRIAEKAYREQDKEDCLKKLVTLELACQADPCSTFSFVPPKNLLLNLIPKEHENDSESFLSKIYQLVTDETTGNTFTHLFVKHENPDKLLELVKANRISDTPNKENLNPLDFALRIFRSFTTNPTSINPQSDRFQRVRCCYFILYNYFTKRSWATCCEKHKMAISNEK